MRKVFILAIVAIGFLAACQPNDIPRVFCVNEPIVRHGHVINQIECTSPAYRGNN